MIFPTYRVSRLRHSSMVSSPGVPPHRPTPSFSSSATSVMLRGHDAMESAGICWALPPQWAQIPMDLDGSRSGLLGGHFQEPVLAVLPFLAAGTADHHLEFTPAGSTGGTGG